MGLPSALARHLPDVAPDLGRLWALDLWPEPMPVDHLAWHLDLPLWRDGGRPYCLCPRAVISDPSRYRSQYARVLACDLGYPIDVTWWNRRYAILDGVHRLAKAVLYDRETIEVRKVPQAALDRLAA